MPLYSYEIINENGSPGEIIELFQPMDQPPYTKHPKTGVPIRRLISAPHVSGSFSARAIKSELSDNKRLEQLGFTKYERTGKGVMERRAGKRGPKVITSD